jgi:eukaryotic-like serine/threonine-protein kinase
MLLRFRSRGRLRYRLARRTRHRAAGQNMSDLPTTIGRYEIRRELGRGTMGVVYEALDPVLGRRVALKTIQLAFPASEAEREAFEKRFFNEARVAAGLQHPSIVVIHDFGRDPASGVLFMALEYLAGRPLSEEALPLEPREALRLIARVAEALHVAHEQGIVHRDIKPGNIMRLPSGDPKILDFGIAKAPASDLTAAGQVFGTPVNMSPEQTQGQSLDGRSDLFSLGTVLYHLLTGVRAFHADSLGAILGRVMHEDPPPPSRLVPGLPAGVDAVVARALAKDPTQRYRDGRAFASDLTDILEGHPPRHADAAADEWTVVAPGSAQTLELTAIEDTAPLAELAPAPKATTAVPVRTGEMRRRIAIAVALGAVFLAGALWLLRSRAPAPGGTEPEAGESGDGPLSSVFQGPARLSIDFEHHLKSGTIRVWVDDELVLEQGLDSRVTKKLLSFTFRKGAIQEELEVSPGRRRVRVQLRWDDNDRTETISATFKPGALRTLEVRVGRLRKNLSLDWR